MQSNSKGTKAYGQGNLCQLIFVPVYHNYLIV